MHPSIPSWFLGLLLATPAFSQLIGPVGPTTPLHEKNHECNILQYGGKADNKTDVALSVLEAFEKCAKPHPKSRLVVPGRNYLLKQSIDLVNGTNWAFQLDGLITAQYAGNFSTDDFILIENGTSAWSFDKPYTDGIQRLISRFILKMVEVPSKEMDLSTGITISISPLL